MPCQFRERALKGTWSAKEGEAPVMALREKSLDGARGEKLARLRGAKRSSTERGRRPEIDGG